MSFICIPGVFGRRKEREPGFDDAELAGSGAKAGSSSSSANTPRSISDRPRSSTRARLSPSQFLTPQERTPSSERTTSTSLFHGAKALQFGEFSYIDASRASNVVINTEAYALDASDRGEPGLSQLCHKCLTPVVKGGRYCQNTHHLMPFTIPEHEATLPDAMKTPESRLSEKSWTG